MRRFWINVELYFQQQHKHIILSENRLLINLGQERISGNPNRNKKTMVITF